MPEKVIFRRLSHSMKMIEIIKTITFEAKHNIPKASKSHKPFKSVGLTAKSVQQSVTFDDIWGPLEVL